MVARSPAPSVLIADAEYYICRVLEAKLTKDDQFRVVTATTGHDALQAAVTQTFDVLLWDMRLRNTFSLIPRLRALCPRAFLFLMSTDDRPMINDEMSRLDVAGVLVKPFGLDTLIEQLHHAMENPMPTRAAASVELSAVGQQLTIVSPGGTCVTRVLEKNLDSFAVVGAPRVETPADFETGRRVHVQVRGSDALYSFGSRLLRANDAPIPNWELSLPRIIRRDQRRKSPRLSLQLPIALTERAGEDKSPQEIPADSANISPTEAQASGVTDDLSLGGCALVSEQPLAIGAVVSFTLQSADDQQVRGVGRVVRIHANPLINTAATEAPLHYRVAVQFTELETDMRRRLRSLLGSEPAGVSPANPFLSPSA